MMRRLVTRWLPAVVVSVAAIIATSNGTAAFKYLSEGMTAPAFEGEDLRTGEKIDLGEFLGEGDRAIVVVFWATWSERSLQLLEDLVELVREKERPGLTVLAVNVESPNIGSELRDQIAETVQSLDLPFPVILDDDLEIFAGYGVVAVPSTAVLDGTGVLRYGPAGYSYFIRDQLVDSVAILTGEKPFLETGMADQYVPVKEASRYYNLARQLVIRGMHERSLEHLDRAAEVDPGFAAVEVLRGEVHLILGDTQSALAAFELATTKDDGQVSAWAGLGIARGCSDDPEGAEQALRKAIELDPAYTPAMIELARCRIRAGDFVEALGLVSETRQLLASDPELDFLLGEIKHGQGDQQAALAAYEAALEAVYPVGWNPRGSRR
jgi:tetratricopeptide (TPR) repeat protein